MDMGSDLDRLLFFEHACKTAEAFYAKNPQDANNLTRWGGSLMELSQFQDPGESKAMLQKAVEKLEEALEINPIKHDAMWCLGNALTTHAFLISDLKEATPYLEKAADFFDQAARQDPRNELYMKSLEVSAKAPELHGEIHKGSFCQSRVRGGASSSNASKTSPEKKESGDVKYEIMGWVIVVVGIVVAWLGYTKNRVQTKPLPR